ncbi:asparagine synthase (glutamine-hydrolyzing) [Pedobacter sp. KR3-3]|uniref:asparagine synthase (glutamine-hydrolyzing) n=1 Tax=Pedobacter albus TaxID=3113905 RepID=A0ABU7I5G4_9SPHI|nr:asparagine synthase (glutamine-hydrolyzing) [Pedobacter sp. KR3-3]MEE1944703.1 asparagine synthase (glutamine-hydrolyzing) [Pedobacter sp. KR3-3]
MCGITGFIDHTGTLTEQHLRKASASIAHRGGNGSGFIIDTQPHYTLALANERLATIDLSPKSQQPLTSHCGNYSITFNGTIYNYLELREALIKYGIAFSTLTDTEVILESYKRWGYKAFEKLDGSFAFALLDRKQNQLLLAKDEIGAKPLYYFKQKGCYAFASEIRALLQYPIIEKAISPNALATYFRYGYFIGEETIYQHIYKFKKGILTTIDIHSGNSYDSPLTMRKPPQAANETQSEEEILAKIEELLTESILKRNVADVPIGLLLSGGYDSATTAAILQKNQTKRIKTYTLGFKDEKLDEVPQARKIAEHLKTNHHELYLDKNQAKTILKELPEVFDEPIGDSGAIPLMFIAANVNKEYKVLLSAEGGDELFGGYRTYSRALQFERLQKRKIPKLVKQFVLGILKKTRPQLKEVIEAENLLAKYLEINASFTHHQINRLLNTSKAPSKGIERKAQNIKDLLIYDLHNYLPNNILFKSERCFAHYGIDNRDALLKTDLVDYLATLDSKWFIKDGEQKYLLKKITNKYIPASYLKKPQKGFGIPLANWLKTSFKPLIETYLSAEKLNSHGLFNLKEVQKIKNNFYTNGSAYNAQKVWLLLQFQMWHERWVA